MIGSRRDSDGSGRLRAEAAVSRLLIPVGVPSANRGGYTTRVAAPEAIHVSQHGPPPFPEVDSPEQIGGDGCLQRISDIAHVVL
jgi:hypothetical protein